MRVKAIGWSYRELSLFTPEDMMTDVVMADAVLQVENWCWGEYSYLIHHLPDPFTVLLDSEDHSH